MKARLILLSSMLLATAAGYAQKLPVDSETQKITYTEVVEIPGAKKDDLYSKAKAWFVTATGATKLALELEDKETGKLLGKVNNSVKVKNPPMGMYEVGFVNYTISIIVKDDKYKYTFTDFNHESGGMKDVTSSGPLENKKSGARPMTGGMPTGYQWGKIKEVTEETVLKQVETLKKAMAGNGKKETDF